MAEDRTEKDDDTVAMERLEAVLDAVDAGDAARLDEVLAPLHAGRNT